MKKMKLTYGGEGYKAVIHGLEIGPALHSQESAIHNTHLGFSKQNWGILDFSHCICPCASFTINKQTQESFPLFAC
jgi:hypothetical protein